MVEIQPGRYKHYKGKLYEVIGIATHSETLEKLVVYKALYEIDGMGENSLWVRPAEMFLEHVEIDCESMPRFARVE